MSTEVWLLSGLVSGIIGLAYFVYGKKQSKPVPLLAGLALMLYPYFFDSLGWTIVVGIALVAVPFVYRPSD